MTAKLLQATAAGPIRSEILACFMFPFRPGVASAAVPDLRWHKKKGDKKFAIRIAQTDFAGPGDVQPFVAPATKGGPPAIFKVGTSFPKKSLPQNVQTPGSGKDA